MRNSSVCVSRGSPFNYIQLFHTKPQMSTQGAVGPEPGIQFGQSPLIAPVKAACLGLTASSCPSQST